MSGDISTSAQEIIESYTTGMYLCIISNFVRPLAYRSPDYLIIHAGTIDLINFTAKGIIANFQDIVETIIEIDPKIKIIFSSVVQRFDNDKLQPKVVGLN